MTDQKVWVFARTTLRCLGLALLLVAVSLVSRPAFAASPTITPPSATVAPLGTQMFSASGGSGSGYTWSLSMNNSGGNISAAGLYTAGATGGVMDQVEVTDSASNTATANVTVTAASSTVQVLPATVTLAAGGMQTFIASGGTAPYTWAVTTNASGGASVTNSGVYTAGMGAGMDVVTATDSMSNMGSATVTVTVQMVGIGDSCTTSSNCPSGATCVDGVCCSTACTGQCQACNSAGSLGTCVTITGPPVGTRPSCPQSDPNNVCTSKTCDGTSATSCTSFVGPSTICGVPSCIDQIGTPGAVCEGDGGCQKVAPKPCGAYACVSDQCATSCNDTSECSPGNYCDVTTGKCIVPPPVPDAGGTSGGGGDTPPGTVSTSGGCSLQGRPSVPRALLLLMGLVGLVSVARLRRRAP
jgi:hypothetical protein